MSRTKLGLIGSLVVFGAGALALRVALVQVIPRIHSLGVEPPLGWFLGGGGVFAALLFLALWMYRHEGHPWKWRAFCGRCRLRRLTVADWGWTVTALALIAALTGAMMATRLDPTPPALAFEPLDVSRAWIMLVWVAVFWPLNIAGEELLWRGILLPRQELALGRWAWLVNTVGWALFHVPFGVPTVAVIWPLLLILPYIVWRQRNTWIGIIVHAALNGPGFVAVAFGLV
jgi:membrane protease YdiL (CAAX protease family)